MTLAIETPVPLKAAAMRFGKAAPGSKNPAPPVAEPVTVIDTLVWLTAIVEGVSVSRAAGGGATRRTRRNAYESFAFTYCCSVHIVMSSDGSRLV